MGQAKLRGTFEQRKAQRMSKQWGLTNEQLDEAYEMNRRYNYQRMRENNSGLNIIEFFLNSFNYRI